MKALAGICATIQGGFQNMAYAKCYLSHGSSPFTEHKQPVSLNHSSMNPGPLVSKPKVVKLLNSIYNSSMTASTILFLFPIASRSKLENTGCTDRNYRS